MKNTFILLLLAMLSGCTKDPTQPALPAGKPALLSLSLDIPAQTLVESRAVSSPESENQLNNLYLLIFDTQGRRLQGHFYAAAELTTRTVTLTTFSGSGRHIYGVANIGSQMMNLTAAALDAIETEADFQALNARLNQTAIERGNNFLMSGYVEDNTGAVAAVTIPAGTSTATLATIRLRRVDSKIRFNITTPQGVSFTPNSWRVAQIPRNVGVVPNTTWQPTASDSFTSNWANFESEPTATTQTFAFYLLENRQPVLNPIPTQLDGATLSAVERYALREKQVKTPTGGSSVENGAYLYAPQNATYVQVRGSLVYKPDNAVEIAADVLYTIHLGYLNNDPNDFNNLRNTYYIYHVEIQSVDKILVEVQADNDPETWNDDNEQQPGAEGTVNLANQIFNLDAHYETAVFSIAQSQISPSLSWSVSTPFGNGMAEDNPADWQWVLFRLNAKNNNLYRTDFSTFSDNYTAGAITLAAFEADPTRTLDVKQLIAILKEAAENYTTTNRTIFDTEAKVTFTAFINENYYERNPADLSQPIDLWKKFVNCPDRVLNILSQRMVSNDGQSQQITSVISFRQAAIQTIYDLRAATQRAWGSETVQDTAKSAFSTTQQSTEPAYTSYSDGRSNTLKMWGITNQATLNWTTYINSATNTLRTNYDNVRYKCMRLNRDNNGNGRIDADEVRWYLAAINQLTDLWIGENSLAYSAHLFRNTTWVEAWYASSTVTSRYQDNARYYDNPLVLWSSEGSSVGPLNQAISLATVRGFNYRCVRNLGVFSATNTYEDVATYDTATGIIDLEKLDSKSIRGYTQLGELPEHSERMNDNKPWRKFRVENQVHGNELSWIDLRNAIRTGTSPCPTGWRVPNQRELALMYSRVRDSNWKLPHVLSRTAFGFNPVNGSRYGFAVSCINNQVENIYLINSLNNRGGVRCVRDVE